jgi:hypothetical protein
MSEYQYVGFRAIDGPLSEEDLDFMQRQSSRAEITPLTFDNEYHFGAFRGDAAEMMRRGYDLHLHYANFGTRTLMIRLPDGLPFPRAAGPYFESESLTFLRDKKGPGGIVCVQPSYEPGDLDDLWEVSEVLDRLIPLRGKILDGDLRPLYLAHLAVASDSYHDPAETKDVPVPAGLDKLTGAQRALAELYELDESLVAAAAQNSPPLAERMDAKNRYEAWLKRQPVARKNAWLCRLLADPGAAVRREILAEFRKSQRAPAWPTVRVDRTVADLQAAAEVIQRQRSCDKAEADARQRAAKLATMAADPARTLRETEELVKRRSVDAYDEIAELLADLREALAGSDQSSLPDRQARKLKDKNPTLHRLTAALREHGLLEPRR